MALTVPLSEIVQKSSNPLLAKHESWGRVLLGEVATVLNGFAFKSSEFSNSGGVPLIRIRDVGKDRSETTYLGEYDPRYVVEPGDLLVGMDGDFNCARWRGPLGLLNQRVCKITLKSDIYLPKFLDYTLPGYLKAINDVTSSVTVKHLSSKSIEEIPLPLPPKEVQEHLVAEIEKQFSRLDQAVANLKRTKANLKRYKAAVLKAAVEGSFGLSEAGSWTRTNLGTALAAIEAGKSFKCEERMPNNDEIGVVKVSAVTWGKYNEEESKTCLDADRIEPRYFVRPGDFLFSRANTIDLVGACVIAQKVTRKIMLSDKILRFRFSDDVLPQWALYWLRSDIGRKEIQRLSTGNQESMRNIGQDRIRQITFALPNLDEQQQIVAEVERRLSVIEELETRFEVNLTRADRLRKSVLQQAFSGQLVSETPNTGSVSTVPVRPERMQIEPTIMPRQNEASFQEVTNTMANLIETLASVRDWISAQEAFRLCGIGSGTGTDTVERIYEELRGHIDSGRIVVNRRGESDWLCLSEHRGA